MRASDAARALPRERVGRVILIAAVVIAVLASLRFSWMLDDSWISLAYARSLVRGDGLVFNPGEFVEGYTCFLWVMLGALGLALGIEPVLWVHALGATCFGGIVAGTYLLIKELAPDRPVVAAVASLSAALYWPLAFWAGSGMETAPFAAFLVFSALSHVRRSIWAPALLVLLSMTRPEGWLFGALCCTDAVRRDWRTGLRYCLAYGLPMLAWFGWRVWYYGDWLPNTFRAKVGGGTAAIPRGLDYLWTFLIEGQGALFIVAAAAGIVGSLRRAPVVVLFVLLSLVYVVAVGGDVFHLGRFLAPLVPLLIATAAALAPRWFLGICAAAQLVFMPAMFKRDLAEVNYANLRCAFIEAVARNIAVRVKSDDLIATAGIGAVKWYTDAPVLDILGLVDKTVAATPQAGLGTGIAGHERSDAAYVFSRRPRFIVIPTEETTPMASRIAALVDIWHHPELNIAYRRNAWGYERLAEDEIAKRRKMIAK